MAEHSKIHRSKRIRRVSDQVISLGHSARLSWASVRGSFRSPPNNLVIFVIGTGRSGTTWMGQILNSHPEIVVSVERQPIFDWVTEMALYPASRSVLLPKVLRRYRAERLLAAPRHYADKSHPNIWLVEELTENIPEALFIGMFRGAHATVASMLKHREVLSWVENWKRFPLPNWFLGITDRNQHLYDDLPLAAKCALRWRAHRDRLYALKESEGDRLMILNYEALQDAPQASLESLRLFLSMEKPFPLPNIRHTSRDRWQQELSAQDIAAIDDVITGRCP
jgi:hypothetical protein